MGLNEEMAEDLAELHADAYGPAISVTHVAAATSTQTANLKARFDRDARSEPAFEDARMVTRIGSLIISVASLPAVELADSFLIEPIGGGTAETWKIQSIDRETPVFREISVVRTGARRFITAANEHDRARSDSARQGGG